MRLVLVCILFLLGTIAVEAAPRKKDIKKSRSKSSKSQTEVSFDEILVQGKHHFSDEAVITVEQDKVLDALLEVPKDFKDRIAKSAKRN